ncbi:MAG: hypothetical protein HeimC2_10760 [Candidatus Heimdallarchaeota archaeon LC_2]|nr:MAG: hypothetical protein HeimC2_10760 [Candidatus Heimdallarchaeota archaeon LC_2]
MLDCLDLKALQQLNSMASMSKIAFHNEWNSEVDKKINSIVELSENEEIAEFHREIPSGHG